MEVEAKEDRLVDVAADGLLPQSKTREKMHELRVQCSRIEACVADIGEEIAVSGQLLAKAIDRIADPKAYYKKVTHKVRMLLNESFFHRFFVYQDGAVGADLNQPFDDIFVAHSAYGSTNLPGGLMPESTQSSETGAVLGVSDVIAGQFLDTKNGAEFSTPSLLFKQKSVYSNHGRCDRTRTCDLVVPNDVRFRGALQPIVEFGQQLGTVVSEAPEDVRKAPPARLMLMIFTKFGT